MVIQVLFSISSSRLRDIVTGCQKTEPSHIDICFLSVCLGFSLCFRASSLHSPTRLDTLFSSKMLTHSSRETASTVCCTRALKDSEQMRIYHLPPKSPSLQLQLGPDFLIRSSRSFHIFYLLRFLLLIRYTINYFILVVQKI